MRDHAASAEVRELNDCDRTSCRYPHAAVLNVLRRRDRWLRHGLVRHDDAHHGQSATRKLMAGGGKSSCTQGVYLGIGQETAAMQHVYGYIDEHISYYVILCYIM